ncbi:MAG: SGNH/GDSL hydrolase family protein [Syntrophaceae bacterium]|nr:SGNH/GDSL hydrolase family protein [Syntrophaceae bacterium]
MKSNKNSNCLTVIVINLGILIILLFFVELILQTMHYCELRRMSDFKTSNRNIEFEYNLFLQIRLKPNGIDVNRFGFRSPEITRLKQTGVVRIAMLGGSTTADLGNAYQNTYPALLVDMLKNRFPGKRIEFINAGCDWYTSEHSIINYLFWIKDFHPDIVIFMHTINDLIRSFPADGFTDETGFKEDYSHYYGHVTRLIRMNREYLHHHFFSEFLLWKRLKESVFKKPGTNKIFEAKEFASLSAYKRNLQSMISILQADHVELIFVSEGSLYRPDEKYRNMIWMNEICKTKGELPSYASMKRGMELFNDELNKAAEENGISIVRGDLLIPKEPRYFRDDVHLTVEGNKMLAEAILNVIKNNNKLSGHFKP